MVIVEKLRSKKQEQFVQLVIQGVSQRDAFRTVYHNKMTDAQVDCEASAMLNGTGKYRQNPKIHQRYLELKEQVDKEAEEKSIAKAIEMQQVLTNIIRQNLEEEVIVVEGLGDGCSSAKKMTKKASIKDIISAINTLGKFQGVFNDKPEQADAHPTIIIDL